MPERERLIEILNKAQAEAADTIGSMNGGMAAWYADKLLEAGVAPVVHGEWERIHGMAPPEYHGRHKCSVCGRVAREWKLHEDLTNYCSNCGAKLAGGT